MDTQKQKLNKNKLSTLSQTLPTPLLRDLLVAAIISFYAEKRAHFLFTLIVIARILPLIGVLVSRECRRGVRDD